MECLVRLQKRPNFIDVIEKFQLSGAYPVFFAVLCTISGLGNKYVYLPTISILALCILFSIFFVKDSKVFLTPIIMVYYSLGSDNPHAFFNSNGDVLSSFDGDGFAGICILAAIVVIPLIVRLIADGSFTLVFKQKCFLVYGILALDVALLLSGAFSGQWTPKLLLDALIVLAALNFFFIVIYSIFKNADPEVIPYTCRILVATCIVISAQVLFVAARALAEGDLFFYSYSTDRWAVQRLLFYFSWGIPTHIGAITAIGIPAALYLAKNERFPLFYYISSIIFFFISVVVNTRSSMLVGGIFLVVGIAIISFSGRNRKINLIFSSLLFLSVVTVLAVFCVTLSQNGKLDGVIVELAKLLRLDEISARTFLFEEGWVDFLSAPLFGVGLENEITHTNAVATNFFSNMYHCVVIQMIASAGIVGLAAFLFHIKDFFIIGLSRFKIDRLFLLSVPVMILCMSLFDNFFFYPNFQIPYVTFLLLADKHREIE